jgi:hypothetical protein
MITFLNVVVPLGLGLLRLQAVRSGGGSVTPMSRAYFATAWSINPEMLDRFTDAALVIHAR